MKHKSFKITCRPGLCPPLKLLTMSTFGEYIDFGNHQAEQMNHFTYWSSITITFYLAPLCLPKDTCSILAVFGYQSGKGSLLLHFSFFDGSLYLLVVNHCSLVIRLLLDTVMWKRLNSVVLRNLKRSSEPDKVDVLLISGIKNKVSHTFQSSKLSIPISATNYLLHTVNIYKFKSKRQWFKKNYCQW